MRGDPVSALVVGLCGGVVIVCGILLAVGWADLGQYGEPDQ